MKRRFRRSYTVRYDDGDCYGLLTPATFLRYLQDLVTLDAEDAQFSGAGYWVARRTIVNFSAPVPVHSTLELETSVIGATRITAQRSYTAHAVDHVEPLITARTLWVYLDARGRPARMPEEMAQIWLPDGPLPPQPEAAWPVFPESRPERSMYSVRFLDIDPMQHMNNAAYAVALDNAAWDAYAKAGVTPDALAMHVLMYDIEYAESARFGDQLEVSTWLDTLPVAGQECTRLQQIKRGDVVLVRARSRWYCQQSS
jgi:acyl-CoA thioesterase FadM